MPNQVSDYRLDVNEKYTAVLDADRDRAVCSSTALAAVVTQRGLEIETLTLLKPEVPEVI